MFPRATGHRNRGAAVCGNERHGWPWPDAKPSRDSKNGKTVICEVPGPRHLRLVSYHRQWTRSTEVQTVIDLHDEATRARPGCRWHNPARELFRRGLFIEPSFKIRSFVGWPSQSRTLIYRGIWQSSGRSGRL